MCLCVQRKSMKTFATAKGKITVGTRPQNLLKQQLFLTSNSLPHQKLLSSQLLTRQCGFGVELASSFGGWSENLALNYQYASPTSARLPTPPSNYRNFGYSSPCFMRGVAVLVRVSCNNFYRTAPTVPLNL